MSRKELELRLASDVEEFNHPDILSEQYVTLPGLAADFLWQLQMITDLTKARCIDVGCGTGMLGYGLLLLGAEHVTFVDNDGQALQQTERLLQDVDESKYDIILQSAEYLDMECYDICVQNPPFGTRNKHIDTVFLKNALNARMVFTMHKAVTRRHIVDIIRESHTILYEQRYRYPLKNTQEHHTEDTKYIDVSGFITEQIDLKE